MPRAVKTCSTPGCPRVVERGRCSECSQEAERARGTSAQRGYNHQHRTQFREAVLAKHPFCQCDQPHEHGHAQRCTRRSEHADHYPLSRRELVALSLDPNDPQYGRGLCHPCHSAHTAHAQPGGWAANRS